MTRREFIALLGGTAAWPLTARGQQSERVRLIGVLLPIAKDDPEYQPWISAFRQALQDLGWIEGRNIRIDIHWATGNPAEIRKQAAELAALAPDVILAPGTSTVGPLMQATRTVPIVFPIIADPVAGGFVDSLARPGRNATGFMLFEYSISGKWLELLKQIAPGVIVTDEQGIRPCTYKCCENRVNLADGAGFEHLDLQPPLNELPFRPH